eukprot:CAMPEP_0172473882 /NCGR_PEP_ID=MMETSP1065-20121228/69078_1 /TAXON_ID=265537 /ORGANISM="Amphiprora paludosa, Strain CCMP125" /LENGTH=65 /DNA_ID=CAMNT_0013232059 /DNA_START=61 /DNA_END=258 /DNA_ORIENTATION=-
MIVLGGCLSWRWRATCSLKHIAGGCFRKSTRSKKRVEKENFDGWEIMDQEKRRQGSKSVLPLNAD